VCLWFGKNIVTEFSEDEMRRPTPQVRSTLKVCKCSTGS
jgi:hypothetical protein